MYLYHHQIIYQHKLTSTEKVLINLENVIDSVVILMHRMTFAEIVLINFEFQNLL